MAVSRDDLEKFNRRVPPLPPRIEPQLSAAEEAKLIADSNSDDPTLSLRRDRVLAILRRAATPDGEDAELVALLAAAGALPLEKREDRLSARQRLVGIGNLSDPPAEVRKLFKTLRVPPGNGEAFAEALLPASRDSVGDFFTNWGANASGQGSG